MGVAPNELRGSAIVVGLPWLKSGTTRVMQMHVSHLRSLGFRTRFVAVPGGYDSGHDVNAWNSFVDGSVELGADQVFVANFTDLTPLQRLREATLALMRRQNAMHWALAPAHFAHLHGDLRSVLAEEDVRVILVNHVFAMPFAMKLKRELSSRKKMVPIVVVTHDVQSHSLIDREAKAPWTLSIESEERLVETEVEWLAKADALIHISENDFVFFEQRLPMHKHHLLLPALPPMELARFPRENLPTRDLLYIGVDNPGNVESIKWYFKDVVPHFGNRPPKLTLAGSICSAHHVFAPTGTEIPWLELAGPVDDLRPYYASSKIAVGPTIRGQGISIKTIESFAAGLPVAGTDLAFRGIPHAELAMLNIRGENEPRDLANLITSLMSEKTRSDAAKASSKIYRKLFTPAKSLATFAKILAPILDD